MLLFPRLIQARLDFPGERRDVGPRMSMRWFPSTRCTSTLIEARHHTIIPNSAIFR